MALVVESAGEAATPALEMLVAEARTLVARGMRKREAAIEVALRHAVSANDIYQALVR